MTKLDFANIQFYGIDSMEPAAFSPANRTYTIRRRAGTDFSFVANMTRPPAKPSSDGGWGTPQYTGYSLEIQIMGHEYKDFWTAGQCKGLSCTVGESEMYISCDKTKGNRDESAQSVFLKFIVITEPMAVEAVLACPHYRTHSEEGECWGGGSGSCCVEILSICDDCGCTIGKSYDNRD